MTILTTGMNTIEVAPRPRVPSYTSSDEEAVGVPRLAITRVSARDVYIDPSAMDADQPYGYRLDGVEYVVVRRSDGRLDFFELPRR